MHLLFYKKGPRFQVFTLVQYYFCGAAEFPTHLKNQKFRKRKLEMVKKSDDFEFGIDRQTLNLHGVRKKNSSLNPTTVRSILQIKNNNHPFISILSNKLIEPEYMT